MTLWSALAAAGMLMWAISLALAMAPQKTTGERAQIGVQPTKPHSWLA